MQWENYLRYHDTCINFINLHKPYKCILYLYKLYSLTFRTHLTFHQFMDFADIGLPSNTLLHLYNNNLVVIFKIKLLLFFFSYVLIHIACLTNLRHENSTNPSNNSLKLTLKIMLAHLLKGWKFVKFGLKDILFQRCRGYIQKYVKISDGAFCNNSSRLLAFKLFSEKTASSSNKYTCK